MKELDDLGIVSSETLNDYLQKLVKNGVSDEDISKLANVDLNDLWENALKFDNCCILGANQGHNNIDKVNFQNTLLAHQLGLFDYFNPSGVASKERVLEIGAGFGSFYMNRPKNLFYTGIDVVPQFPQVQRCDGKGIPQHILEGEKFDYIFSSNVFQHIPSQYKRQYILDTQKCLKMGGYLILGCCTSNCNPKCETGLKHKERDEWYAYTCGQLVKKEDHQFFLDCFFYAGLYPIQINRRYDGMTGFICRRMQ